MVSFEVTLRWVKEREELVESWDGRSSSILILSCKEKNGVALGGLLASCVDLVFNRKGLKINKGKEPLERSGKTLMELKMERQTKAKQDLKYDHL